MASIEAAINVVVKGSNAVNRLIENVSQLQSAVDRINSKTLDIAPKALQQRASGLTSRMEGSLARINELGGSRNRILSQQRQAVERLTQAQLSQQRALERAADAEKELSRLARRDEIGSRRTAALKQSLRDSAAEAERFGDEMSNAASSAQELQARIGAIGRATKNAISSAGALINVNQTLSASNAVKALAEEYNRYGDSLRRSAREAQLSDRTLPKQIDTFNQFTRQIEQAESSLQSLRSQLRQLGSMETMIQVPANQVNPQELLTPAGLRGAAERAAQIEQAQQENELRQQRNARRSEVASEISTQESNLVDLERRTAALGKQIAANQDKVAQSMKKRDPGSQTGLSASLNQIQAQAEALALVANNSAVASSAFNKFTVASQVASVKLARAQQSSFAALAAGFSGQAEAVPTGLGGYQADGARSLVAQAVADIPSLTRSEAAINQHISLLSQLKSIVPLLSDEYTVLGDAIDRLNNELQDSQRAGAQRASEAGLTGGTVAQQEKGRAQGPISLLPQFSIESEAKRLRFNKAVEDSFETQSQLIDKINSSSLQVADKEKLRLRANEALNTLLDSSSKTRLQDSKQMVKSIDNELSGLQKAQNYRDALIKKAKSLITSETNRAQTSEGLTKRLDEARSRVEESANANLIDQLQKKKILANIDSAALAIQEKQLKIASALTGDIDKQRISAERITRATKDQSFGVLGTSFVPRGGNLPSGAIPGSPAFERLLQASGGVYGPALPPSPNPLKTGAVSPVGGEFAIKNALMSSEVIQAKLLKLKSQGIPVDQELLDIEKARAAAASDNFENTAKTLKQLVEANALGGRRVSIGNQIAAAQKAETNAAQASEGLAKRLGEARSRVEESANANLIDQAQKKKILANIDSAALAIQEKQLKVASALTGDIDRQRISAERITRATKDRSFGVLGTSFVPRQGNLPSGAIPGSPAFEKLLQASGGVYGPALPPSPSPLRTGAISPVGGEFAIKNALMSSEIIQARLLKLKGQGIPVDRELLDIEQARAAAASDNFENTAKTLKQLVEANALGGRRVSIGNQIAAAQKAETNAAQASEGLAKQLGEARSRVEESANANLIDQLQKKKILANIDLAALAIQEKQLKIASALTGDIDKQRISAERITRATKDQSFGVLGTSFVPRGGNLPSGAIPGSPALERLLQASGGVYGPALPPSPNPLKTGAVSPVGGEFAIKNALMSSEVIQAKLLKLKSQGIPVDKELLDIEKARAAAASDNFENTAKTLKQLVEANTLGGRRVSIGNQIVAAQKEESNNQEKIAKQLKHLQGLHRSYTAEQRKGVVFGQELVDLQDLLTNGSTSNLAANKQNIDALKENIDYMREMLGIRILQAKEAGVYTGGSEGKPKTPEAIEKARTSALSSALGIQGQINSLEGAGIDLANEKLTIETAIARLKEIQGQASEKEVENLKQQIADTSNLVREAKNMRPGEGSTFAPALSAEEVRNRYNKIVSNLDAVIPGTANAGQNVVDTLASELSAGVGKVLSSGIELGMATIKGLRKALKMQSPSRVMVEIALNVVDTYVATLKAAIPQVEAVSKKLADASAQAMQQPASSEFGGLPKEAVRKITPKTSSFYIESAATNLVAYAANLGEIADLSKEEVLNRARAAITSKGAYPITENIPGMDWNKLQNELFTIPGEMAELARKAYRDFYGVNSKLLPEASTGVTDNAETAAANLATAEQEAKQLNQAILELVNGFDSLVKSVRAAATPLQDTKGIAGPGSVNKTPSQVAMEIAAENDRINAEAARRYAEVKSEFERSVTEAARIDEEQRKRAIYDSFAASREQAIFDAEAAAGFTSRQLSEPAEEAAFDGGNKVKSAIEQIFDRIASRLKSLAGSFGGMGGGGGGGGRGASGGRSDSSGGASDPSGPVSQTAEAMSMLGNISRLTNNQLEELEQQLAALRNMADATGTEFKQLTKDLAAIGREQEKRDPNADMLTASVGPRTANAISEGLIGGAFPLLFGQGIGASIFGGLGGAAGGFAGGGLGFGLSLIGTAIGTAVDEAENLDKALVKVNAGVKGVGSTSGDVEKLASSLGIAKEEAVKLLDQFKQFGSAKIRSDVASVFGGGREAIFEKLESSLKERDVLDAIIESRKTLTNQEASGLLNVLKAEGSLKAQLAIREAILRVAENEVLAEKERVTLMDRILSGFASGEGARIVTPEDIAKDRRNKAQAELNRAREARRKSIEEAIKESQRFFKEVDNLSEKYKKDDDRKRLAEQYLAAIEAREDGLSNVRIQYEEKIAEIRKGAIEAAAKIEEELADKRKQLEREIDDVRRGREDKSVDLELRLRELRGEDQSVISAERDAIRAQREERDARIELERKINDDQQQQERTIAEFRKGIARQIQDANLASARAIGEVQKNFAKATSKIIDEGTGKSAKRLEISGRIVSLEIERAASNIARSFNSLSPISRPMASGSELLYPSGTPNRSLPPEDVPPRFLDIDKRLRDLYRQLGRTSQAGAGGRLISMSGGEQQLGAGEQFASVLSDEQPVGIGEQFISMVKDRLGFEDIAGLQPLPWQKMLMQMGRPFTKIYREILQYAESSLSLNRRERNKMMEKNPERSQAVLKRIEKFEEVKNSWDPFEAEWKQRENNLNRNPRSKPSNASLETFKHVLEELSSRVFARLNNMEASAYGILGDISDYLTDNELEVIRKGVKEQLMQGVAPWQMPKGGHWRTGRAHVKSAVNGLTNNILSEMGVDMNQNIYEQAAQLREILKQQNSRNTSRGGRGGTAGTNNLRMGGAASSMNDFDKMDVLDQLKLIRKSLDNLDPPQIIPGPGNRMEGAWLPTAGGFDVSKLPRSLGEIASIGVGSVITPEMTVPRIRGVEQTTETREQLRTESEKDIDAQKRGNVLVSLAKAKENILEMNRSLAKQGELFNLELKYLESGIEPSLARQLATLEAIREEGVKDLNNQRASLLATKNDRALVQSRFEMESKALEEIYNKNVKITTELEKQNNLLKFSYKGRMGQLSREMNDLVNTGNIAISAAGAISGAFSDSFKSIVSGSDLAENALANLFQRTADHFIEMATQIIAKQLEMELVGVAFNFFGSLLGGGARPTGLNPAELNLGDMGRYADSSFAMGGVFSNSVVDSPTLFKFADGGALRNGVMGEAGPEAVMPLTRGPGGSLGVRAYLADSRAALDGGKTQQDEEAFADNRQAIAATSTTQRERYIESVLTSGPQSMEIKYSRVNSGDLPFVTEEDMLQASRAAAQEGAKMGEKRALVALRNNPSTRRSVGI